MPTDKPGDQGEDEKVLDISEKVSDTLPELVNVPAPTLVEMLKTVRNFEKQIKNALDVKKRTFTE